MINIKNNSGYICNETFWLHILDIAKKCGWKPEGTRFDFSYALDEFIDDNDEPMYKLFILITVNNRFIDWNGSYVEKDDQIVMESDVKNLLNSLIGSTVDTGFIDFLAQGSFRISSV